MTAPTKFPVIHALRHLLTPGTPAYALIKLVAVAVVFGLLATRGRSWRTPDVAEPDKPRPHPTSKKKRGRKRRRR